MKKNNEEPKKTIAEVRAERGIGTQLTNDEFAEQMKESHEKKLEDYKKYLEVNGYKVVKI